MEPGEPPSDGEKEQSRLDAWLGPFLTDSLLWPVTIAAGTALVMFASAILLLAARRNPFAWAALVGLVLMTADGLRGDVRRRKLGPGGAVVVSIWTLAVVVAVAVSWLGLF